MVFADLNLARRLERAEGHACAQFAAARARLIPDCGSAFAECAGGFLTFDGLDAPTTQSFALGVVEDLTPAVLDQAEAFFFSRGSAALHEICPLAGPAALQLLCARGYRPIEISNVLFQPVIDAAVLHPAGIDVRLIRPDEANLWSSISARGWSHEHPELEPFVREFGALLASREGSLCFLAEIDGTPGAAGTLALHQGVALFAGAATVPELRCRGLQRALLQARMRSALEHGCDIAMMVTETGSNSQRNAERQGFHIAYTRTKWQLDPPPL